MPDSEKLDTKIQNTDIQNTKKWIWKYWIQKYGSRIIRKLFSALKLKWHYKRNATAEGFKMASFKKNCRLYYKHFMLTLNLINSTYQTENEEKDNLT